MVSLEKEMAELDQQLSVEKQTARTLQLTASSSAKKREELSREIGTVISELCELEMEAEDFTSLQPQEHSTPSVARPGQKGAPEGTRSAMHAACNEFVAACLAFKDRHSTLQQDSAAAEARNRSHNASQKMSEARAALASANMRHSSAQEQLSAIADARNRILANSEELRARLKGEAERGARLQDEHGELERVQRKALEEAEKQLCASTLQDEAAMELQKELQTLHQQIRKEERTGISLRNTLKSKEDELASLRRSLQALSGPAQPYQTTPAVLGTSAGSGAPTKGDTGVFCESAQGKAAQIGPSGKASYQGHARLAAEASSMQQQRARHTAARSESNTEGAGPTAWLPTDADAGFQQQQHQGAADQSDGAGHPALTPPLEPVPYTVQEPDSPPSQLAGPRPDASAKQMPPTCIFMETTITRTITPGRNSARAESTWTVRKVHQAGESTAAHCPDLEGFHTADRQQQDALPFRGAPQSFRESPAETGAGVQHRPIPESNFEPSRGGKGSAGARGKKAKRPRKRLKRILGSDDEDSLALYQPDAADERFRKAQLEAEGELLLSSLW
ncbi:g12182 [Coccomyxa viridis]|uniref:G12182 protein n=1 Tax=Coccomyxa viridis TaxID=1274662 RepID=A0ABP1G9P6_9CHLO